MSSGSCGPATLVDMAASQMLILLPHATVAESNSETAARSMDHRAITELAAKAIRAKWRDRDSYATLRMTEQLLHVLPECPEKSALVKALATGVSTDESDYMDLLSALNRAIET